MSLNLISSLSLLKSRLEKTPVTPRVKTQVKAKAPVSRLDVRRLNSADMFCEAALRLFKTSQIVALQARSILESAFLFEPLGS